MNYRHSFHAGNFADVLKHLVLIALLQTFSQKDKPFCYLDTHAGSGLYTLSSQEYQLGIAKIMEFAESLKTHNDLIQTYMELVRSSGYPKTYPGSPMIADKMIDQNFRKVFFELHPEEIKTLKKQFQNKKNVLIFKEDGYQALKSQLPPMERRGLTLIDPPYEKENELQSIMMGLKEALKRFETGVYALWYPIKDRRSLEHFLSKIKNSILQPILNIELTVYPFETAALGLVGSGLIIINPPWKLQETLKPALEILWKILSNKHQGYYRIDEI